MSQEDLRNLRESETPLRIHRDFRRPLFRRNVLVPVCIVLGTLLLVVASFVANRIEEARSLPPITFPPPPVPPRMVLPMVEFPHPIDEHQTARDLEPMLNDLKDAFKAGDGVRVARYFDADRVLTLLSTHGMPAPAGVDPAWAEAQVTQQITDIFTRDGPTIAGDRWEIRRVRRLNQHEAFVVVRNHHADGRYSWFRWWVTRRFGSWKVFDHEDIHGVLHLPSLFGAWGGVAEAEVRVQASAALFNAHTALHNNNPDGASQELQKLKGLKLLPFEDARRLHFQAVLASQQHRDQDSLSHLDELDRQGADLPMARVLRARALNNLSRWGEVFPITDKLQELFGETYEVTSLRGVALQGQRRFDEAVVQYRKALDDYPNEPFVLLRLLQSLSPTEKRADIPGRILRLQDKEKALHEYATMTEQHRDDVGLEQLAQALRQLHPQHPTATFHLAQIRVRAGKIEEGLKLFHTSQKHEKEEVSKRQRTRAFQKSLTFADKADVAYGLSPDKDTFRYLAEEIHQSHLRTRLRRLIQVHALKHGDDPLLPFYRGEMYVAEGRFPLAEKAFAEGLRNPPEALALAPFRTSRVLTRQRLGRAMSAYAEIGPRDETFDQLVRLLDMADEDTILEQLLDAHAREAPEHPLLHRHRYRLAIRKGRTQEGIALFQALQKKRNAEPQERQRLESEFLREMFDAGRLEEAYPLVADAKFALEDLAEDMLGEQRGADLRKLLALHRTHRPKDARSDYFTGLLFLEEKAPAKAVAPLLAGWQTAVDPGEKERIRGALVRALHESGRWVKACEDIGPKENTSRQLAWLFRDNKMAGELLLLAEVQRGHGKMERDALQNEAIAWLYLGETARAAKLATKLDGTSNPLPPQWFYDIAARMGQAIPVYEAAADKAVAFFDLAAALVSAKKTADLRQLLALHQREQGDDVWLNRFRGELALAQGEFQQAEQFLRTAVAFRPADHWSMANSLARAVVKSGKTVQAWKEREHDRTEFANLARVCVSEKEPAQLAALIAEERRVAGAEADTAIWEYELLRLSGKDAEAVAYLRAHREELASRDQFAYRYREALVRSLVRSGQIKEALQEARPRKRFDDGFPALLAHAAANDAPMALAFMERQHGPRTLLDRAYADEDLGPLLRGPAFQAFRERYPEPPLPKKE